MEKLLRFVILIFLFIVILTLLYSIIPGIVWIFGGSFREVAQHPMYVICYGFTGIPAQFVIFSDCFDHNFRSN